MTRLSTRGKYSHCELAVEISNNRYLCYSASYRDRGVRAKIMRLPAQRWDLVPLAIEREKVWLFYQWTHKSQYDLMGALGLVLPFRHLKNRYFCSEWCFAALSLAGEGWRFSPSDLFALCQIPGVKQTVKTERK